MRNFPGIIISYLVYVAFFFIQKYLHYKLVLITSEKYCSVYMITDISWGGNNIRIIKK